MIPVTKLCKTCKHWTGIKDDEVAPCGWAQPLPFWATIQEISNEYTHSTDGKHCDTWLERPAPQ